MVACRYKNFSSRVKLDISLVRCAHSWAIELHTRREISYLGAPRIILYLLTNFTPSQPYTSPFILTI